MVFGPECGLFWCMFYVTLRKMCILLLSNELVLDDSNVYLLNGALEFLYVLTDFLPVNLSISEKGVLRSSTIIVDSFSPFSLMYFGALLLGKYTLWILVAS